MFLKHVIIINYIGQPIHFVHIGISHSRFTALKIYFPWATFHCVPLIVYRGAYWPYMPLFSIVCESLHCRPPDWKCLERPCRPWSSTEQLANLELFGYERTTTIWWTQSLPWYINESTLNVSNDGWRRICTLGRSPVVHTPTDPPSVLLSDIISATLTRKA